MPPMYPVLVDFGFFKIHSFGLMLALAYLAGSWLVSRELERRGIPSSRFEDYPVLAIVGGVVGARLYYVAEHLEKLERNPLGTLFGSTGLTWYGGVAGGAFAVLFVAHRHKRRLWDLCDSFAAGLAAAYAIGRIGCQLAGDGDYGIPSDVPWAMAYPNAVVPTDVAVHPTPVYEMIAMGLAAWLLWHLRTKPWAKDGRLFGLYLVLAGVERFFVEFVRTNEVVFLGLTGAQGISVIVVAAGLWIFGAKRSTEPPQRRRSPRKRGRRPAVERGTPRLAGS